MAQIQVGDHVEWTRRYDDKYFTGTVIEIASGMARVKSDDEEEGIRTPMLKRLKRIKDSDMNQEDDFWLVWNPDGTNPHYRHRNKEQAQVEATRLARQSPGQNFFVLHAELKVQAVDVVVTELVDIPF